MIMEALSDVDNDLYLFPTLSELRHMARDRIGYHLQHIEAETNVVCELRRFLLQCVATDSEPRGGPSIDHLLAYSEMLLRDLGHCQDKLEMLMRAKLEGWADYE